MAPRRKTTGEFIEQAKQIHGDRYDYSLVQYEIASKKVIIKCRVHGEFLQRPSDHIFNYQGCPKCYGHIKLTPSDYDNKAISKGYTWLGPEVPNGHTRTWWLCSEGHKVYSAYAKLGCIQCRRKNWTIPPQRYSEIGEERGLKWLGPETGSVRSPTNWLCPKGHIFSATLDNVGRGGTGCPSCKASKGESRVAKFLDGFKIRYTRQKKFDKCRSSNGKFLPYDFYFENGKIRFLIEYDGVQHFEPQENWKGRGGFKGIQLRDAIKTKFAQDNGFILIRVPYTIKSIEAYLQFELEKHLPFSLDHLKNQPQRPQPKIKPINPYQWKQEILL